MYIKGHTFHIRTHPVHEADPIDGKGLNVTNDTNYVEVSRKN